MKLLGSAAVLAAAALVPITAWAQSSSLRIQSWQSPVVAESPPVPPQPLPTAMLAHDGGIPEPVSPPQPSAEDVSSTLEELTFMAQTANPALREASAKVGVAQGNAVQVGLYPNPTLYTSSPQWTGSISQYNVFVGQDFITAGKLKLNRAAAQRAVEQAQLDFTRTRFEVLTGVRRQFYLTAAAQRRVEVLSQLMQIAARSRDLGNKLQKAGETNKADATLLEIEWDKAEMAHRNSLAALAAAKKQLAAAVGVPDYDVGRLMFNLNAPLPEYEHEALRLGVVDRNALAGIAALDIRKTQIELRRALVEPRPNFNIQAGYQYAMEGTQHDQGYGQFSMAIPLWNRNQGGIRAAQAETARANATLQRVENDLSQQTAAALGAYAAAIERVAVYEQRILPKARDVFDQSEKLFEQGQTDFLRLLQSQRTLVEADLGYLDAQEARWSAGAAIAGLLQVEQFP